MRSSAMPRPTQIRKRTAYALATSDAAQHLALIVKMMDGAMHYFPDTMQWLVSFPAAGKVVQVRIDEGLPLEDATGILRAAYETSTLAEFPSV